MRGSFAFSVAGAAALVAMALALLLLSGCLQPVPDAFKEAVFTPLVKGCAETADRTAVKAVLEQVEREPTITVEGNTIVFNRAVFHLCCRKAVVSHEFSALDYSSLPPGAKLEPVFPNTITIYETWSGPGCKCQCFSELGARIEGLAEGTYNVMVVERGFNSDGSAMAENVLAMDIVEV